MYSHNTGIYSHNTCMYSHNTCRGQSCIQSAAQQSKQKHKPMTKCFAFSAAVTKHSWQINLKELFIPAHSSKLQSTIVGTSQQQVSKQLVSLDLQSRGRGRWVPVLSSLFPFYTVQNPSPAGMSSHGVNLHRHAQRPVPWVIPYLIKLQLVTTKRKPSFKTFQFNSGAMCLFKMQRNKRK